MTAVVVMLALVVALLTAVTVGLLRSHAEILRALHGQGIRLDGSGHAPSDLVRGRTVGGVPDGRADDASPLGTLAMPELVGVTPDGEAARVALAGTRQTTLLAFLTTGCTACASVWRDIAAEPPTPDDNQQIVIVTRGPEAESRALVARLAPPGITVLASSEAWDAFGIAGAPYFVLVDGPRGTVVGEGSAAAWSQVRELLARAASDAAPAPRRSRREVLSGRRREDAADRALRSAGVLPGDPSLYPGAATAEHDGRT